MTSPLAAGFAATVGIDTMQVLAPSVDIFFAVHWCIVVPTGVAREAAAVIQRHPLASNDIQRHPLPSDIHWHPTTSNDIQRHALASNDIQRHPLPSTDIQRHPLASNDVQRLPLASNDIQRHPSLLTLHPFACKENPHPPHPRRGWGGWGGEQDSNSSPPSPSQRIYDSKITSCSKSQHTRYMGCHI